MIILYRPHIIPEKKPIVEVSGELETTVLQTVSDTQETVERDIKREVTPKVTTESSDLRKSGSFYNVPSTTISRKATIGSGTKKVMEDLTDKLPRVSRKERVGIQKELRRLSYSEYFISHDYTKGYTGETRFCDLNGTLIGVVTSSPSKQGFQFDTTTVRNLGLTFEKSSSYQELIRVTAFLTEAGINGLRAYLDRQYLSRRAERLRGYEKRVYDLDFNGIFVHVNLRGKIDIYTESDVLEGNLVGFSNQLTHRERSNLGAYTRFSAYKKWPRHTNNAINTVVGDVINQLSIAVAKLTQK